MKTLPCVLLIAALAILTRPAVATTYYADANGRFFVTAFVNNVPLRFQVDTGADKVSLNIRDAVSAGINRNDLINFGTAQLAGGAVVQTAVYRLRQIQVGRAVIQNAPAMIILTNEASDNLLGLNILSRLGSIHITGQRLTIDDGNFSTQQVASRSQMASTLLGQCNPNNNSSRTYQTCLCAATLLATAWTDQQFSFAVSHNWTAGDMTLGPDTLAGGIIQQGKLALRYCGANG